MEWKTDLQADAWPDYTTAANGSLLPVLGVNSSKLPSDDIPECGLPAPGFSPDLPLCNRERKLRPSGEPSAVNPRGSFCLRKMRG